MDNTSAKMPVLAMYDVRGIQKYIFKTPKVKDARGASAIVETIIDDAMKDAVVKIKRQEKYQTISYELEWCDNVKAKEYFSSNTKDIQVLFVGGGNASYLFSDEKLCIEINKLMSKYVIQKTYSLQLAAAFVEKTNDYKEDYKKLQQTMTEVKAKMVNSVPLGTLPIMKIEQKTGYPIQCLKEGDALGDRTKRESESVSEETRLKRAALQSKVSEKEKADKIDRKFDSYTTKKGTDSNLAVVHIDGNNMGLRIRALIEDIHNYEEAVNQMREISYNINQGYKSVFDEMSDYFNRFGIADDKSKNFVLKILVAGDDITYICNAGIAIETVRYFCDRIVSKTMIHTDDPKSDVDGYGFSVCAGIAYFTSHFPFSIAYEVAESCCDKAKKRAKEHSQNGRVANYLDYQICKNIQTLDLDKVRSAEYHTHSGEKLIRRPYYISIGMENDAKNSYQDFENNESDLHKLSELMNAIKYFRDEKNIPRSLSKKLRNLYPEGESVVGSFTDFLKSRNHKMPDGSFEMYCKDMIVEKGKEKEVKIAKWYDALELMDYCEEQLELYEEGGK